MIFHVDCTVAELSGCEPSKLDDVIGALLRAHRLGDHIVVIGRELCRFIAGVADISRKDKAILERIALDYTQAASLVRAAKRYVRIRASHSDTVNEPRAIDVDFDQFLSSNMAERGLLLVENIASDGLLYSELMKSQHDLLRCPHPAFNAVHGGGDTLTMVFVEMIKQKRIVCGVVDRDKSLPNAPAAKAAKLVRIAGEMSWPLAFGAAPPCREAENCLPMELVMQLQSGKQNGHNGLYLKIADAEMATGCHPKEAFWLFVDLKEGVETKKIAEISDIAERQWLEAKLALLPVSELAGYGPNVFSQLVGANENLAALRALTRTAAWREIFSEFMEILLWIFAGGRRLAT